MEKNEFTKEDAEKILHEMVDVMEQCYKMIDDIHTMENKLRITQGNCAYVLNTLEKFEPFKSVFGDHLRKIQESKLKKFRKADEDFIKMEKEHLKEIEKQFGTENIRTQGWVVSENSYVSKVWNKKRGCQYAFRTEMTKENGKLKFEHSSEPQW